MAVAGQLGHDVLIVQSQFVHDLHVALAVQGPVADFQDDVPALERIIGLVAERLDDEHAGLFFQAQLGPQGLVLGGRHFFAQLQFAGVGALFNGLEQHSYLLGGQQVADAFACGILAEDQADELAVAHGGPPTVAGIQGGVDLDPHGGRGGSDTVVFDPRNNALGDRKLFSAHGVAIDAHALFHGGQIVGQRQGRTLFEKGPVVDFDDGHVEFRHEDLYLGRHPLGRLVGLHENLAGVGHDVGIGENPLARQDDAAAGGFAGRVLGPGAEEVGLAKRRVDLNDGIGNLVLGIGRRRKEQQQKDGGCGSHGRMGLGCEKFKALFYHETGD